MFQGRLLPTGVLALPHTWTHPKKYYRLNRFHPGHIVKIKFHANQSSLEQDQISHGSPLLLRRSTASSLLCSIPLKAMPMHLLLITHKQAPLSPILLVFGIIFCNSNGTHTINPASWIIDTGATDHMICTPKHFIHHFNPISRIIKFPNGATTSATHIGDVRTSEHLLKNLFVFLNFPLISFRQDH